jgi:hypothetical protein
MMAAWVQSTLSETQNVPSETFITMAAPDNARRINESGTFFLQRPFLTATDGHKFFKTPQSSSGKDTQSRPPA